MLRYINRSLHPINRRLQADVVTVSTLISCCERMGDWRRALEVWDWMVAQVGA